MIVYGCLWFYKPNIATAWPMNEFFLYFNLDFSATAPPFNITPIKSTTYFYLANTMPLSNTIMSQFSAKNCSSGPLNRLIKSISPFIVYNIPRGFTEELLDYFLSLFNDFFCCDIEAGYFFYFSLDYLLGYNFFILSQY